ncbi:hypothetical protein ANTRET_LOCUS2492 [Anthophora retusa]
MPALAVTKSRNKRGRNNENSGWKQKSFRCCLFESLFLIILQSSRNVCFINVIVSCDINCNCGNSNPATAY